MTDSVKVAVAKEIVAQLEIGRAAAAFEFSTGYTFDWDFEGRVDRFKLTDTSLHVTVIVPKKYEQTRRICQTELGYVAAYDIDVVKKLGVSDQDVNGEISQTVLTQYDRFVEQIHAYFLEQLASRITASSVGMVAEWIAEREGIRKQSEILASYSVKHLADDRIFFGCCREVFEITEGT